MHVYMWTVLAQNNWPRKKLSFKKKKTLSNLALPDMRVTTGTDESQIFSDNLRKKVNSCYAETVCMYTSCTRMCPLWLLKEKKLFNA